MTSYMVKSLCTNYLELIDASANGRIEDVKRLVANGVDTNWKNHDG